MNSMNLTSNEKQLTALRRQEFDDLQNEIAGRDTGRRHRFLRDGPVSEHAKRKERDARAFQTRLAELLADPVYQAKYDTTMDTLTDAESAVEAALTQIGLDLANAHSHLEDLQDRAARLPDGSRVYKDANGSVRREDGTTVDAVLVDTILWSGNEPSFEEYETATHNIANLEGDQQDVEGYQNDVLGSARDRLTDQSDPPSLDELDAITESMETAMPDIVQEYVPASQEQAPEVQTSSISLPKLGG